MCDGIHYWEVEGLVSVERWSCNRGASCLVEYTMGGQVRNKGYFTTTNCLFHTPHLSRSCSLHPPWVQPFIVPPHPPTLPSDTQGEWPITTVARQESGRVHPSVAVRPSC